MGYRVKYSPKAEEDIGAYKKAGNKVAINRINRIEGELKVHPREGIGKPEQMKHKKVETWSRRVDEKNRMTYEIKEDIVTVAVVSAMGHYDDK